MEALLGIVLIIGTVIVVMLIRSRDKKRLW